MAKVTKKSFKTFLNTLEKEELIDELEKLYAKIKNVQEYYQMELGNADDVLEEYKKQIDKEFKSKSREPRSASIRKIINEYKKIAVHQFDVIHLLLYRVEKALEFMNQPLYFTPSAAYSDAILTAFEEAIALTRREKLDADFQAICQKIVTESDDYMQYAMAMVYKKYYTDGVFDEMIDKRYRRISGFWVMGND
ncbi:MAG: DUF6155 family protein [Microscillaceae bacterium]|jgi:tetratricopeptide (TPR) repeat protein|nr:DUF6155 family protein [Microscillaceae bacterium]